MDLEDIKSFDNLKYIEFNILTRLGVKNAYTLKN